MLYLPRLPSTSTLSLSITCTSSALRSPAASALPSRAGQEDEERATSGSEQPSTGRPTSTPAAPTASPWPGGRWAATLVTCAPIHTRQAPIAEGAPVMCVGAAGTLLLGWVQVIGRPVLVCHAGAEDVGSLPVDVCTGRPPVLRTVGAQSSRQGCRKRSRRAPRPTWLILLALLALFKHSQKGRGISWVLERMAAQAPCRP